MYTKIIIAVLLVVIGYLGYQQFKNSTPTVSTTPSSEEVVTATPQLFAEGNRIDTGSGHSLDITHEEIVSFFRADTTGMCDEHNIGNTATRRDFCMNLTTFAESASFSKIVPSHSGNRIGFVIETTELAPDTVVGVYYPLNTTYKVHIISNYYLGNDFIGFSPNDTYLVIKDGCFEGVCGFTVFNAATLDVIRRFGNPETEPTNTFVSWISDNRFEYKVGDTTLDFSIE